ncbi:polysaccharide biosynthesis C-terminal domain-containing protein [Patescibacteria group bacterium]|nr:polysaccharide biosynthesis C-terminal domain-containing protein [Patescibacteria group bacterium]
MRKAIKTLTTKNAKNTLIHYFGSFLASTTNYLFHLLLIRLLLPAQYGEFLSYLSFLYLISIPAGTIGLIVSKHIASFRGKKDNKSINHFFYWILRKAIIPALLIAFVIILSANKLSILLKAHPQAFYVLSFSLLTSFGESITGSYLLAFQKFTTSVKISISTILLKIILAFILIKLGAGATGGIVAILITSATSISLGLYNIKKYIYPPPKSIKKIKFNIKKYTSYSLILSTGMLSIISIDMLLVRYFFSPHLSGIYASLSTLGKMIYFGITPISMLAMTLISNRHSANKNTKSIIAKLILIALLLGLIGFIIFSVFPHQVVLFLSGQQYIEAVRYLPIISLSMFLFGLSNVMLTSMFAIEKPKASLILLTACILQPILIVLFHQTLMQVVVVNLFIHFSILLSLILYYTITVKNTS